MHFLFELLNTASSNMYLLPWEKCWFLKMFYWSKVFFTGCMTQSESKKTVRWHKPSAQ